MPVVRSRLTIAMVALAALAAAACGSAARPRADANGPWRDDLGDTLLAVAVPARIVSLSPATTEMLFTIGAGSRVVGRTRWDAYPPAARLVPDLGDGLRPNLEAVLAVHPDLVVLYASDDNRAAATALRRAGIATIALRLDHVADVRRGLTVLGRLTGDSARAARVADTVEATLERVRRATANLSHPSVFWHVWDAPLITIGRGSFLDELLAIAGGRNAYHDLPGPSPQISFEDVVRRDPDVVLAGPEGAKTIAASRAWRAVRAVRTRQVRIVDTALVGRPSVQLGEAAVSLARLLQPELGW
jgi:iron complex transport system substrate-binding protein